MRTSSIQFVHDPIDVLSNRFDEELKKTQSKEAKASEMEHAIKHEIKIKLNENPVFYTSLRENLEQLIQARKEKQMEIQDLIREFGELIGKLQSVAEKSEAHGLSKGPYPFYQLLEAELPEEEQAAKDLTKIITTIIHHHPPSVSSEVEEKRGSSAANAKRNQEAAACQPFPE